MKNAIANCNKDQKLLDQIVCMVSDYLFKKPDFSNGTSWQQIAPLNKEISGFLKWELFNKPSLLELISTYLLLLASNNYRKKLKQDSHDCTYNR